MRLLAAALVWTSLVVGFVATVPESQGTDPALLRARELVREGSAREALDVLRERLATAEDPELTQRLHAALGDTHLMLDEPEGALRHYDALAKARPDASGPQFKRGLALARRDATLPAAIEAFQAALELGHPAGRADARIGACYKAMSDRREARADQRARWRGRAREHLRRALAADPAHATALAQLAELVALEGRHRDALALYERLHELDGGRPETLARLGAAFLRVGEPERARDHLEQSLERIHAIEDGAGVAQGYVYREVRAQAHLDLGEALLATGHERLAREHFEQVATYGECENCDAGSEAVSAAAHAARARLAELNGGDATPLPAAPSP